MEMRWYQEEATKMLMASLGKDIHPIVVAPTGSGKSLMICDFIDKFLSTYPGSNILVLSHVKEILQQDFDAICDFFPDADIGLYSAGLGSRTTHKITVAGIQSVHRRALMFQGVDIVIIDECHLVNHRQTGMYRTFLIGLNANYVGYTATHFRLGHGYIHRGEGALFNKLAYDLSSPELFNRLVEENFLTRLIAKGTDMRMDVRGIKMRAKDYAVNELSKRFDRDAITDMAVEEIIEYGANYKKWLVFAIDIAHAEHITDAFTKRNISAGVVHSKMDGDRDEVVADFRIGKYRAVVNVDILTTGLDVPDIDLIAMLRPTKSPVIHVQTIGRGLRVAPGKDHCLVLDFAGNTKRLGPINDVRVIQRDHGKKRGDAPVKECPQCKTLQHIKVKFCEVCGFKFIFKTKLSTRAGTASIVKNTGPKWCIVDLINYTLYKKEGRPNSMKVTYRVGIQSFSEWICLDHTGYPKYEAEAWIHFRAPDGMPMPKDVNQLVEFAPHMKQPKKVLVNFSDKFPKISDVLFENVIKQQSS